MRSELEAVPVFREFFPDVIAGFVLLLVSPAVCFPIWLVGAGLSEGGLYSALFLVGANTLVAWIVAYLLLRAISVGTAFFGTLLVTVVSIGSGALGVVVLIGLLGATVLPALLGINLVLRRCSRFFPEPRFGGRR